MNVQDMPLFSTQKVNEQGETPSGPGARSEEPSLIDLAVEMPIMAPIAIDDSQPRRAADEVHDSPAHSDLMGELIDDNSVNFGSPHAHDEILAGDRLLPVDSLLQNEVDSGEDFSDHAPVEPNGSIKAADAVSAARDPTLLKFDIPDREKVSPTFVIISVGGIICNVCDLWNGCRSCGAMCVRIILVVGSPCTEK